MKTKMIVTAIIILLLTIQKQGITQTCEMYSSIPASDIHEIAIDSYGNKWMAADDDASGLIKYDGTTYTHYYPPTDLDLTCIAVDANNNIWVGSTETGISKFNGTTWTNYNPSNTGNGIPSTWIVDVAVSPVNGDIWVATATEGLSRFNGTTWTKHNTTTSGGAIPSNNISSVAIDNNGNVWAGTQDGLAEYNGSTWSYNSVIGYQGVNKIKVDRKKNNIWVGTGITETTNSSYLTGSLWKYNGTSWTSYQTGMNYKVVTAIAIDYWSNVYVCESYQNTSYPMWFNAFQKLDTSSNWSLLSIGCVGVCYVDNMIMDNCNNLWLSVPYNGTTGGYGFYGSNPMTNFYANFSSSSTQICQGSSVNFTDQSTGNPTSWQWSFGDGNTATTENTNHVYNNAGNNVTVLSISTSGGCHSSKTDTIKVMPNLTPTIGINSDATDNKTCSGTLVHFTTSITNGGTSPVYQWMINSTFAGTNSSSFSTSSLHNGDTVKCIMTSNIPCYTTNTASAFTVFTVNSLPIAEAGENQTVCTGSSVVLNATGGTSYQWNNSVTQDVAFIPASTKTYIVTVTNANGCSATSSLIVTVNPLPNANAGSSQTVCAGSYVTLHATGGTSYQWNNGVIQDSAFVPSATQTYTVTVTNANECSATSSLTVTVFPLPIAEAGGNQAVCAGSLVTLIATGGSTYQWSGGIHQGVAFVPVSTQTYTVTVTNTHNCSATDNVTITVKPVSSKSQTIILCAGYSITVGTHTYNSTGTYTDVMTAANGCDSTVTTHLTINPAIAKNQTITLCAGHSITVGTHTYNSTGTYTDVFTAANGCDSTVTTHLTVNPAIAKNQTIILCAGHSITVGTHTYNSTGAYTDILTAANGCDSTVTTYLTVNPVSAMSQTITLCAGHSITVGIHNYNSTGIYTDVLTAADGCDSTVTTYLTVNPVSVMSQALTLCAGQSINVGIHTYNSTGTYTDVFNAANGCDSTVTTYLTVNPAIIKDQAITLCAGQSINIGIHTYNSTGTYTDVLTTANGCDSTVITYLTVKTAITSSQSIELCYGQTLTVGMHTYNSTGTYTDVLTAGNGCDSTVTTYLVVNPLPTADAGKDQTVCAESSVTLTATGGISYQWSNGVTQDVAFIPASTQTYTVTVTNSYGCSATDSVTVIVNPLPTANVGDDLSVCVGSPVVFTSTGDDYYQWCCGVYQNVPFYPTTTQTYTCTITNSSGCSTTSSVTVTVNPLPTANAGSNQSVCAGSSVVLNATGGTSYQWSNGVTQGIAFVPNSTQTYTVTVMNDNGCSASDSTTVTVKPIPQTPVISIDGDSLISNASYGNQWYNSNGEITGATNPYYIFTTSANYYVISTINGCSSNTSNNIGITITGILNTLGNGESLDVVVYPNPATDFINIEIEDINQKYQVELYDGFGKSIYAENIIRESTGINISQLPAGVYYLKIFNDQGSVLKKIVKNS